METQTTEQNAEDPHHNLETYWYHDKALDLMEDFGPYVEELENDEILEITTRGDVTLITNETGHLNRRTPLHRQKTPISAQHA